MKVRQKILVGLLTAMVLCIFLNTATADENIFDDDFETCSIGDYPSDWKNMFDGVDAYVSDEQSSSGDRSFKLIGRTSWARMDYVDVPDMPDKVSYETSVYLTQQEANRRAQIGFVEGYSVYGSSFNDFNLAGNGDVLWNGVDVGDWEPGQWYRVRAEIDFTTHSADVYLNGDLVGEDLQTTEKSFYYDRFDKVVTLDKFGFTTGNFDEWGTNVVYFDDVKVTKGFGAVPVNLDIKPGSCPNPLNLNSRGVLPVAILGTEDFNVTDIDTSTIKLTREDSDGSITPLRYNYEDVAAPYDGEEECGCTDLDSDGKMDLTLKFDAQNVVNGLDLDLAGTPTALTITGKLAEEEGRTTIKGEDCIVVLKKGGPN